MAMDRLTEAKLLKAELEEQARLQDKVNGSLKDYLEAVEDAKNLQKSINVIQKQAKELQDEIDSLANSTLQSDIEKKKVLIETVKLLNKEEAIIQKQRKALVGVVKEAKKWSMLTAEAIYGTGKMLSNISKIPGKISNITNQLKDLFEMDKAIRKASLQMGIIGEQSNNFRKNIKSAAVDTQRLGMGIKELAEMQAQFSENVGRNVSMSKQDLKALAEISEGTSLGAEATAQMAADFEAQGVSALRTKEYIEEAANRSSSMGLNTTKVLKNLSQNMKMLNKYRFKDGVKGLVKMSELSARLGVDMEFASGFADKLWNVEGAVETAAQLNVMGGAFARMADPFKLMYMARNDVAGLTEQLAAAAAESATFNKQNGEFEIGAMEMHRLKIIAEQTGLSYEQLTTAAKNAAKFAKIKTQIPFKLDDEAKKFIENTGKLDERGRAYIEVKGEKKFLSQLGSSGQQIIQAQVKEKKTLEERALAAKSFDEQIVNLINMVKTFMMPIVEGLTDVLKPFVEDLMGNDEFKKELKSLGEQLGWFVKEAAGWVKWLGELAVALGPKGIFYTWLTGKSLMFLFEAGKWILNGLSLSQGFLMGTKGMSSLGGGSGQIGGKAFGMQNTAGMSTGQKIATNFKGAAGSKLLKLGGVATGLLEAYSEYGEQKDKGKSTGEAVGRAALKGTGAGLGAWGGAAAGAAIGSVVPVVGTAIGALIGGALGAWGGGKLGDLDTYGVDDGIVQFNKNDKFTKVDDSTMIAGTNKNGNKDLAKVLKYGMLASTPLGWPLLMSQMMKGGSSSSGSVSNKIEFGDLHITGEIKINIPGGTQMATEIVKSQEFKSSITRIVTSQLEKNVNGGKNKG